MKKLITTKVLKKQYIFALILVISILFIIGGYSFYKNEEQSIRKEKINDLEAISNLKINQLIQWIEERTSDAKILSNSPFFAKSINVWFKNTENSILKSDIIKRLYQYKNAYNYEEIFLCNLNKEILISTNNDISLHLITKLKIQEAIDSNKVIFTDFYFCSNLKDIHFDIVTPVYDENRKIFAAIVLRIAPDKYLFPLIQSWPAISKSAETLLLRRDGDSVIFLNELRFKKNTALKFQLPLSDKNIPAVQAAKGFEGSFVGIDYRGIKVLSVIRAVPKTNWFMITKIDKEELYSELYFRSFIIFTFVFFLIILVSVGLFWIYHFRQRNIYYQLYHNEKELLEVQKEFQTTLYSIGDAVITTDTTGRIKMMNPIAEQLTGWIEEKAKQKNIEEVFNIVNEETRIKVTNPVELVLKNGNIVGLANHTVLISKDGREFPIADSGAPIKNQNNEIIGVVLVFRDQTEEYKLQKKLLESETRYKSLHNASFGGITIHDKDLILDCNQGLSDITGYSYQELIGMDGLLLIAENSRDSVMNNILSGYEKPYESVGLHKNGKEYPIRLEARMIPYKGKMVRCVEFRDITEQKLAEEKLKESEAFLNRIIEQSPFATWISDAEGTLQRANPALKKFLNLTDEQLVGKYNVLKDDLVERQGLLPLIRTVYENGETINFNCRWDGNDIPTMDLKGSNEVFIDATMFPIFNSKGEITNVVLNWWDITEQKKAEEALSLISSRNQAILESVPDIIMEVDNNKKYTWANSSGKAFFGDDVLGKEADFYFEGEQETYNIVNPLFNGSTDDIIYVESWQRRFDGEKRLLAWWCKTLKDKDGNITGALSAAQDITEKSKYQQELKESEERFRTIFENATIGLYRTTPDGKIILANQMIIKLLGYNSLDELISLDLDEQGYANPKDRVKFKELIEQNDEVYGFESSWKSRDGKIVFVRESSKIYRNEDGSIKFYEGTVEDITERKKAEEALRDSEAFIRAVMDNLPIGVAVNSVDPEVNFLYMNDNFHKIYRTTKEALSKNDIFWETIYEDEEIREKIRKQVLDDVASGDVERMYWKDIPLTRKGEETTYISARNTPVPGKSLMISTVWDVTERIKAETELRQYEWIIEKKLAQQMPIIDNYKPIYADPTNYNSNGLILNTLGKEALASMAEDIMILLDTSIAVYEENGDYAFGVFQSSWCQLMDESSFKLCNLKDTKEALFCGKWLCHENCWNDSAKKAIETGETTDIECVGGIHLFAVPILVNKKAVGVVNIGYGNPPKDEKTLKKLSDEFNIDIELLRKKANEYKPRPDFIVELGKKRCKFMAQLIGEIIERKKAEESLILQNQELEVQYEEYYQLSEVLRQTNYDLEIAKQIAEENEEKHRFLFENTIQGVVYHSNTGEIIFANKAAAEILGLTVDQMNGLTATDPRWKSIREDGSEYPGETHPSSITIKTGKPVFNQVMGVFNPKKEGYTWININSFPKYSNNSDELNHVVVTFEDITERKLYEVKLKHFNDLMQYIISHASSAIAILDKEMKYVYVSDRYLKDYNLTEQNLIGKYHYDIFTDLPEKWIEAHKKALNGEVTGNEEEAFYRADGSIEWVRWESRPWFDIDGSIAGIILYTEVITERKKAEQAIIESYELLFNLTERVPGVVYQYRLWPDGRSAFPYSSQGMYDIYEVTSEEVLEDASLVFTRIHPDDYDFVAKSINESAKNQSFFQAEFRVILPKQGLRWRSSNAKPTLLEDGSTLWYGIIVDITDLKTTQEELQQKNKELEAQYEEYMQLNEVLRQTNFDLEIAKQKAEESDKLKTAFLQNMSHEIRTPLNGILGFSKLLSDSDVTTEEISEYTGIINQSGNRLLEIVNNVLDIAKIETGQFVVNNVSFPVMTVLKDLYNFFSAMAKGKGINLSYSVPFNSENLFLLTDKAKLTQILSNLINNSIKFTQVGSVVFGYEIVNNQIQFFVRDTGIGIGKEHQSKIFERFAQVDLSITRGFEGAGLGLAICKGLIEILNGKIWLDSEIGKGTIFYFTLPLTQYQINNDFNNLDNYTNFKFNSLKILIAEDDLTSYKYLIRILKNDRISILQAVNGLEAIEIVKTTPDIDLILMDIRMPVLDGIEATKQIKDLKPEIPIIAQTAYAFSSEKERILEAGFNDYITKPIEYDKLLDIINKVMSKIKK